MKNLSKYRDYKGVGSKKVAEYGKGKSVSRGLNTKDTTRDESEEYSDRRAKTFRQKGTPAEELKRGGPLMEAKEAPWHEHWDGGSATAEELRPYGHSAHLNSAAKGGREQDYGIRGDGGQAYDEPPFRKHMTKK